MFSGICDREWPLSSYFIFYECQHSKIFFLSKSVHKWSPLVTDFFLWNIKELTLLIKYKYVVLGFLSSENYVYELLTCKSNARGHLLNSSILDIHIFIYLSFYLFISIYNTIYDVWSFLPTNAHYIYKNMCV